MLTEGLKFRRRIRADKEMHFFFAALPQQRQGMQSGACLQRGMQDIRKGLLRFDRRAVQLQLTRRRRSYNVD